ncbi:hypothetical protein KKC65_02400 [Patescibacteria group bacterium]|nr:hypothetical protein [Patescibacteria group bacterium]
MQRSSEEVKARCTCILGIKSIVALVEASSSPSAAYEMVFSETKSVSEAKAGRWLAVLRRDHLVEYRKIIPTQFNHANKGKTQTEREATHEDNLHK